jgi:lysophospholipase L1-like esterase
MSKIFGVTVGTPINPNTMKEKMDFPEKLPNPHPITINGTPYDGSNAVDMEIGNSAIPFIVGDGTDAYAWTGTCADITEYYEGLTILYQINVITKGSFVSLNINGLGAINVWNGTQTQVMNDYPKGSVLLLTFTISSDKQTWQVCNYNKSLGQRAGSEQRTGAKRYLVGATVQTDHGTQTSSNEGCYIGVDNLLYSGGTKVATVNDVPKALKNPNALTINGVEYDGSEAVNIVVEGAGSETETVLSDNLLDKSIMSYGNYFYYGGNNCPLASDGNAFSYYGFVPLRGAGTYRTKFNNAIHASTGGRIALVDDNNQWVCNVAGTITATDVNTAYDWEIVVTPDMIASGAAKLAFDCYSLSFDTTMIVKDREYPSEYIPYGYIEVATEDGRKLNNVLCEKTAVFLGDSICAGTTVGSDSEYYGYGWAGIIGEANRMNWTNYGKNGATITPIASNGSGLWVSTYADKAISEHPNADYVIFEGGCNDADQLREAGLGVISSDYATFDTTTFSGALESLILKLVTAYPHSHIGYIIPQKMYKGYADFTAANHIHRLYFDRAVEICQKWGIPVIDLWNGSPLNPKLSTASIYYSDGIQHLTEAGYLRITPMIESWMRDLSVRGSFSSASRDTSTTYYISGTISEDASTGELHITCDDSVENVVSQYNNGREFRMRLTANSEGETAIFDCYCMGTMYTQGVIVLCFTLIAGDTFGMVILAPSGDGGFIATLNT